MSSHPSGSLFNSLQYSIAVTNTLILAGAVYLGIRYITAANKPSEPEEMAGSKLNSIIGSIRRKPTTAPDQRTDAEAGAADVEETGIFHDLLHLGFKNGETMLQALTTLASGEPIDDKELLLENGVNMLQTLPSNSGLGAKVADDFINMLYHDLPHPPGTIAGPTARYRRHDGGGNNPWNPEMGKAGAPYSRSVPPMRAKGPNLPDPELVYEQLMRRKGPFRPHPSGLNRLFFSFATIVIHECFQTNRKNPWINDTSSYVDLSTLYGNTEFEQKRVRTRKNGLIFPDTVASERIMLMPPGVVALLMMFARNHNTIAESLLSINETEKYNDWDSLDEPKQAWQDEDIFQLARNINVGFFATVVLKDYVAAILNTPRNNSTWWLNLGEEIKSGNKRVERGTGNVVSVEFAVLYHWHAALSAADGKWMEDLLKWNLPDLKSLDDMTPELFGKVLAQEGGKLFATDANKWTFNGLKRGEDGRFNDIELAELIKDCIEEPAHAFGAHGTPHALKVVDIMGQLQARDVFNVCTMNEFRKYLNLKEYDTFEEWCEDKETARAAELLYGHIDNLELYPGLMAECTKPAMPGSGVCPGQTTGRGILDDAVALVRGDRFLSYDLNSNTLSNWGIGKITSFPLGSYGGMLPYLIFNGLPGSFPGTSSYSLLPFYTPKAVQGILRDNKVIQKYETDRPPSDRTIIGVHTQDGIKKALEDRDTFRTVYNDTIKDTTEGKEVFVGWDEQNRHDSQASILQKAIFDDGFEEKTKKFFSETIQSLVKKSSLKYPYDKSAIDIVRDVTNVAPLLWLASRFAIPIKSVEQPRGVISTSELFDLYMPVFLYQNFNIIPQNEWGLRDRAEKGSETLRQIFEAHLKSQSGWKEGIVDWMAKGSAFEVGPEADKIYHALNASNLTMEDKVALLLVFTADAAGKLTQQASLLVDLYLSDNYKEYRHRIAELAQKDDDASYKELTGFVLEGMRHASVLPGVPRVASKDTTITDGSRGALQIKAHQTVLLATSKAAMDESAFPNPGEIDPSRPRESYTILGYGLHRCFGEQLLIPALTTTLKEIFKLQNLVRAPGRLGHFAKLEHELAGVKVRQYLDANSKESPVPTTMTVMYGADVTGDEKKAGMW